MLLIFKSNFLQTASINWSVAASENACGSLELRLPKGGSLEPIILKGWSPGAQTIPMAIFSNFKPLEPRRACNGALEHSNFVFLEAQSPLKYALETRSPRSLRGAQNCFIGVWNWFLQHSTRPSSSPKKGWIVYPWLVSRALSSGWIVRSNSPPARRIFTTSNMKDSFGYRLYLLRFKLNNTSSVFLLRPFWKITCSKSIRWSHVRITNMHSLPPCDTLAIYG